jgi:hypothetical protein
MPSDSGERQPSAADPLSDLQMTYAWEWFAYHASQRLTAFNFFLVMLGALLVGYVQAVEHELRGLGAVLGATGILVSAASWAMDVRNAELVECGRRALDELESGLRMSIRSQDEKRACLEHVLRGRVERKVYLTLMHNESRASRRKRFYTHSFWLRNTLCAVGCGSGLAMIWAVLGFPGA